jgi:hypothetical protein
MSIAHMLTIQEASLWLSPPLSLDSRTPSDAYQLTWLSCVSRSNDGLSVRPRREGSVVGASAALARCAVGDSARCLWRSGVERAESRGELSDIDMVVAGEDNSGFGADATTAVSCAWHPATSASVQRTGQLTYPAPLKAKGTPGLDGVA